MEELDNEPTNDELSKAINSLASRKAPGSDGIPPDLIKHCKTTLLQPLHNIITMMIINIFCFFLNKHTGNVFLFKILLLSTYVKI